MAMSQSGNIQDGSGLVGGEVLQHGLQRGVVADIPRAQVAEQSHAEPGARPGSR